MQGKAKVFQRSSDTVKEETSAKSRDVLYGKRQGDCESIMTRHFILKRDKKITNIY